MARSHQLVSGESVNDLAIGLSTKLYQRSEKNKMKENQPEKRKGIQHAPRFQDKWAVGPHVGFLHHGQMCFLPNQQSLLYGLLLINAEGLYNKCYLQMEPLSKPYVQKHIHKIQNILLLSETKN